MLSVRWHFFRFRLWQDGTTVHEIIVINLWYANVDMGCTGSTVAEPKVTDKVRLRQLTIC